MPNQRLQSGSALLIFVLVLLGLLVIGLSGLLKSKGQQAQEQKIDNIKRLQQAKEALLSYTVDYILTGNDVGDMGKLPCPDLTGGVGNGNSAGSCEAKGVNSIGYFPYKTVGLGKVEDSSKECFWYAVSANYKNVNAVTDYNLRNWDSNGFFKVVDENGTLQHGNNLEDYPIALIISPQKNINQDRTPDVSGDLSDCRANYILSNYLEGGPNIDYTTDLPLTVDSEWTFLQPSAASQIDDVDYNDQVIAIYKNELWDRVKAINNDLDASNPASAIQNLTANLSECLSTYMTTIGSEFNNNGVYPSDVILADYTNSSLYQDNNTGLMYGRFPEDISTSNTDDTAAKGSAFTTVVTTNFVTNYCNSVTTIDLELWENWKDHFFLISARDFLPGNLDTISNKCTVAGHCLNINTKVAAAIILFAKEGVNNQDRTLVTDEQVVWNQYMNNANQTLYLGTNATNDFITDPDDYAYCVVYDTVSDSLSGAQIC